MSFLTEHPRVRWAAPAAAVVLIAGTVAATAQASDDPDLPPRTPEQLLVDLQQSELTPMSGTVVQSADLGLPELPGLGTGRDGPPHQGSSEFSALLSGTHTLRVWYDGPERARIALVGTGGESDLIRNGRDLWLWSSAEKQASHYTLPEDAADRPSPSDPSDLPMTPEEAAQEVLDKLDPTTTVTSDGTTTVAGRSAYELVLEPKSDDSLVEDVRIAVDAERKIPLRVQVHSTKTADPAFEVGFTDIDFTAPEPRMFKFTPPPGTEVTEGDILGEHGASKPFGELPDKHRGTTSPPTTVGEGWGAVLVTDLPEGSENEQLTRILESLPRVSGDWGSGRLLTGTLFSAVLTDNGRLAVGMVEPGALYRALS